MFGFGQVASEDEDAYEGGGVDDMQGLRVKVRSWCLMASLRLPHHPNPRPQIHLNPRPLQQRQLLPISMPDSLEIVDLVEKTPEGDERDLTATEAPEGDVHERDLTATTAPDEAPSEVVQVSSQEDVSMPADTATPAPVCDPGASMKKADFWEPPSSTSLSCCRSKQLHLYVEVSYRICMSISEVLRMRRSLPS